MNNYIWAAILIVVGTGAGLAFGYFLRKKIAQAQANSIEAKADKILTEAKNQQQQIILQGKEKAAQIVDEAKREEKTVRQELHSVQERLERRETMFDQKLIELQNNQNKL